MQKPWMNLRGPARMVAMSSTVLLVASGMLGIEAGLVDAGLLNALGLRSDMVLKPFVMLGYLEICAIFFSSLGIIAGILGMIFHRPFRYISDRIFLFRARRAGDVSNQYMYFEDVHPTQARDSQDHVWRD
jgi:hypothetical protein